MSDCEMQQTEDEGEKLYVRKAEHVRSIIKHAKLDERNLTPLTQALYYPNASVTYDNLKLLELDEHMLQQIQAGQTLQFKGGLNEKAVLCTDDRTYDIKSAEISNSLLLIPNLKFAAATSNSPLKSPRAGNSSFETSRDDSMEDGELPAQRELQQQPVLAVMHEYIECREIQPRFRKLSDLLQLTRYSGPENEDEIDRKLLFTFEQMLDTVQCSRKQFMAGVAQLRAIEFMGYLRVLECEYECRIITNMINLITENSWALDEVDREVTVSSLDGIAPMQIVEGLFDVYTVPAENKPGKYSYKVELVARIVAQYTLQRGSKFCVEDFLSAWRDELPDGMYFDEKYLRGLCIINKDETIPCVQALNEQNMPTNIAERMKILFKLKRKWTLEEMEPYIECFTTPTTTVSMLLAKYARSLTEKGQRFYVSKY